MPTNKALTNYGLIVEKPQDLDYIFGVQGSLVGVILQPTGQWNEFLPKNELQLNNNFDTFSCVTFSALNCVETIFKRLYDYEVDFSDRYTSVASGTIPSVGNSLRKVAESIRTDGFLDEEVYPFTQDMTQQEFFKPLTTTLRAGAKQTSKNYIIKWEWVDPNEQASEATLMEALKYSPLQITLRAWGIEQNGIMQPFPGAYNHAIMLYGYKEKEYWLVYDHYQQSYKKLAWHYNLGWALRYFARRAEELSQGELVKVKNDPRVYYVGKDGKLAHIVDEKTFNKGITMGLWNGWDSVKTVDKLPALTNKIQIYS